MEVKKLFRNSADLNYQMSGNGEYTLLFIHGSFQDHRTWQKQVEHFDEQYVIVTVDLPGHGNSGKERKSWTIDGFADDVNFLVSELNLQNVILIGHSLGAYINLIAATSVPENFIGFIGIEAFKNAAVPTTQTEQKQIDQMLKDLKENFAVTLENFSRAALVTESTPKEVADEIGSAFGNAYEPMGQEITTQFFDLYKIEKELLPKLAFKLHLIEVDYYPTNESQLEAIALEGIDLQIMNGTCHYPMLENPKELNTLLENAIDSVLTEVKNNSY